nr:MAG TPA: hypothetical protein [Microviridae sp.]
MSFLAALATGAKLLGGVSTLVNAGTGIYNALKGNVIFSSTSNRRKITRRREHARKRRHRHLQRA